MFKHLKEGKKKKKTMESMKVKVGVHHNEYDGCCMKQWVKFSKVTWTSSIWGKRSTCQIFFRRALLMKEDVNDEVYNGTFKTLIPSNGVLNLDGVSKSNCKPRKDMLHIFEVE